MKARVNVGHEGVEVGAALGSHRRGVEKQVHQQRLAAPDRAENIQPARRLGLPNADQPLERARRPPRAVTVKPRRQRVEATDQSDLRGVRLKPARGDEFAIALLDGKAHRQNESPFTAREPASGGRSRRTK